VLDRWRERPIRKRGVLSVGCNILSDPTNIYDAYAAVLHLTTNINVSCLELLCFISGLQYPIFDPTNIYDAYVTVLHLTTNINVSCLELL
jgi:hypothetical protein